MKNTLRLMKMNLNKKDAKNQYTLKEILNFVNGDYKGFFAETHIFTGVSSIENNKADKVTFAEDKTHIKEAEVKAKGLVIVDTDKKSSIKNKLMVNNVRLTYAKIAGLFAPIPYHNPGISDSAVIKDNVKIGSGVSVNANTYIGNNSEIADNVVLAPGVKVGDNVKIGKNTIIPPNVVIESDSIIGQDVSIEALTVIGSEGYGYISTEEKHYHIPQLGNVVIEDEVEIGANVTIDRGTQTSTIIGRGTKIDNQVQIAHNVRVGKNCLIVAECGIAGSSVLGDNVVLAGGVGIIDHIEVGDNVKVGAASIVTSDIPSNSFYLGNPAQDKMKELKARALRNKLPEYRKALRRLKETDK